MAGRLIRQRFRAQQTAMAKMAIRGSSVRAAHGEIRVIQSGFQTLDYNPGNASRRTFKGYRRPVGFAIPVVFKPAKRPSVPIGTVRIVKGK